MFSAPLLEGIWITDGSEHYVLNPVTGKGTRVHEVLASLVDQEVQAAFHHIPTPPTPMGDPSKWINIKASGTMRFDADTGVYTVLSFEGSKTVFDFSLVHGHCARFLGVTTKIAEQMRETVDAAGIADMVKGLTAQAEQLRGLLNNLPTGDD